MGDKKKIIVSAMGKNITIDNPDNIKIVFRGSQKHINTFDLRIDAEGIEKLWRAFGRLRR